MKRKHKPIIICISGIDGSGKTSICRRIKQHYECVGLKVDYVWLRFAHYFSLFPLSILRINRYLNNAITLEGKSPRFSGWNGPIGRFYAYTQLIDLKLAAFINFNIKGRNKDIILCDRFVIDTIVDLSIKLDEDVIETIYADHLLRIKPKNAISFIIDADEKTVLTRRYELKNDMTLSQRRYSYLNISNKLSITVIKNDGDILTTIERILNEIENKSTWRSHYGTI
jgi:thymidylate kinase